jgi:hypothetical protein
MRLKTVSLMLCCATAGAFFSACAPTPKTDWMTEWTTVKAEAPDARMYIPQSDLIAETGGEWVTPMVEAPFDFDELIYSWNVDLPDQEGFRLFLRVGFGAEDQSPWLFAGSWGDVEVQTGRENPTFDRGYIAMDQLLLKTKADRFQFKVVNEGEKDLSVLPALYVVTTDNDRVAKMQPPQAYLTSSADLPVLDLPYRTQNNSAGEWMPGRCQSAALATALQYYGDPINIEDITGLSYDLEYDYPGIWPRTIAAANELGYDAYIDRFRTWDDVANTIRQGKVILISMVMPKNDDYVSPPYESMEGHIIALNGITADGRVIVTDSALKEDRGARCQWLREDMEKVWFKQKGGVGLVIVPPADFQMQVIDDLPDFPRERPTM